MELGERVYRSQHMLSLSLYFLLTRELVCAGSREIFVRSNPFEAKRASFCSIDVSSLFRRSFGNNICLLIRETSLLLLVLGIGQLCFLLAVLDRHVGPNNEPCRRYCETWGRTLDCFLRAWWTPACYLPRRIVLTASGTLPPCHFRVLRPNETACEKLSWPRRIPDKRAI
jgi:hypothetical protein